ncbi:MAG: hypothetical protein ABIL09_23230, partial [Gemmatimonadota bacterium]
SAGGAPDAETVLNLATYTIPANTIKDGTVVRVKGHVLVSDGTSAATLTIRARLGGVGGTLLVASSAVNVATNDYGYFEIELHGTAAPGGTVPVNAIAKVRDLAAAGADAFISAYDATNAATNGALDLVLTGQWNGGAADDDANLTLMSVSIEG